MEQPTRYATLENTPFRRPSVTSHLLHIMRAIAIAAEMQVGQTDEQRWFGVPPSAVRRFRAFVDDYEEYFEYADREVRRGPVPARSYDGITY